jgi:hypothetical protein
VWRDKSKSLAHGGCVLCFSRPLSTGHSNGWVDSLFTYVTDRVVMVSFSPSSWLWGYAFFEAF